MKNFYRLLILLLLLPLFLNPTFFDRHLTRMIGQTLMIGFRASQLSPEDPVYQAVKTGKAGAVVLYDYDLQLKQAQRNIVNQEQLISLTKALQNIAPTPLLIAIDVEGGLVNRLKPQYGFKATQSARALGDLNDLQQTQAQADKTGLLLKQLGINLNFAPVVDLDLNPGNPAIAQLERSFSNDPATVVSHALAFIRAFEKHQIIACIKHFPGHGSAGADSHLGFVDVTEHWSEKELIPYQKIIASQTCPMIMTAHIYNQKLDPQYPATLSGPTLDILRKKLHYKGIIISDDMQMKAISSHYTLEESISLAFQAGVDLMLFSNNMIYDPQITEKFHSITRQLIREKKLKIGQLRRSFFKIMRLKKKYLSQ